MGLEVVFGQLSPQDHSFPFDDSFDEVVLLVTQGLNAAFVWLAMLLVQPQK